MQRVVQNDGEPAACDRGSQRPLRLLDHLGFIVDTRHVKLCVLKQNFGDGTVSHADIEHAKRTVSALGEAAQCLGEDLMHVVEERPGETPQGIVVAELAGEAPLAEPIAAFRYYFLAHCCDPDVAWPVCDGKRMHHLVQRRSQ
jgi:hypothetical protein